MNGEPAPLKMFLIVGACIVAGVALGLLVTWLALPSNGWCITGGVCQ